MREGYKEIEFIKIPETWKAHILGSESPLILKEIRNGLTISQSKENGKYKVSRIETISNETIDETRVRFVDELDNAKLEKYLIRKGEILFSHINSDPHLGKTAIAEKDYTDLLHGMNLLLFTANDEVIDPFFLNYIFKLYRQIGVFLKIRSRAVNQSSINQNKLKNLQIPLPPLPEQRKIAYILSTVQKAIEQQDKLIRHTTQLKKALMQKLFTEGTKGEKQKQTEIGLVPESWEVVNVGNYLEKTKLKDPTRNPDEEFIYVDVSSVSNELFRVTEANKLLGKDAPSRARKLIQTDDVIFATVRPTLKRIAKITEDLNNQVCSTGYCVLKPLKLKLHSEFLYQYLQMDDFIVRIEKLQRGASYPAVRDSDVKAMTIPFPKYSEQTSIGNYLKTLDQKKNLANSKKQTLTALFKTLLHELMTGQRRVHEIEFEALNKAYKIKKQPLSMAAEK